MQADNDAGSSLAGPSQQVSGPAICEPSQPMPIDPYSELMPNDTFHDEEKHGLPKQPRRQFQYMQEFVSHVNDLLQTLLSWEALPNDGMCAGCASQVPGYWRCKDCTCAWANSCAGRVCGPHTWASN